MTKDPFMRNYRKAQGYTLVELLLAITFMAALGAIAASALFLFLESDNYANTKATAQIEGTLAMERITEGLRVSTMVLVPNGNAATRDVLAFSGSTNDDNDFYFGDALFPRVDEDSDSDANADAFPGIELIDEDGDTSVDEGGDAADDDEDGVSDEEILNGADDDGDGHIDEDLAADVNGDGASGILDMDDDGDGNVDEDVASDDDEDGASNEDPFNFMVYHLSGGQLLERGPTGTTDRVVVNNVTAFSAVYEAPSVGVNGPRYLISLSVDDGNGDIITFSEYVYPRNAVQRTGKRVR